MTNEQINELLELEAKATPGPWNVSGSYEGSLTICQMRACTQRRCVNAYSDSQSPCGYEAFEENAALIAAARNSIRELAEEVKRLRAAMEKIENTILTNSVKWRATSEALNIAREALGK